jgi:GDP-mannose transporter
LRFLLLPHASVPSFPPAQAPVFILILQLAFAAIVVKSCSVCGVLEAEKLRWGLMRPFLLVVFGFLGTLYANIKVLMYSNVETFITFRSSTPLVLSLADWIFLGRELPGGRSIFSLVMLLSSCAGYTYFDQGFKLQAYGWLCVWYCFFLFEACWVKFLCDSMPNMTNWGRVFYTNFMSATALAFVFPFCKGEHELLKHYTFTPPQIVLLFMSCAIGVCMSHAGYLMRSNVSATAGVVVGVVCKIGSVLINLLIWDQHASPIQLVFLSLGLAGGALFQQAPLRKGVQLPLMPGVEKEGASPVESGQKQPGLRLPGNGSGSQLVHKREGRLSAPTSGSSDKP